MGKISPGSEILSPCLELLCARPEQGHLNPVVTGEAWLFYHESLLARSSTFSLLSFLL